MRGQPREARLAVERGVARIEQRVGRMVDVDQHGVEGAPGRGRIEARFGRRQREEIAMHKAAARLSGEFAAERDQAAGVPVDHRLQRLDHDQR